MKIFKQFPENDTCPICKGNEDKPCILIPIQGTEDGNNVEAKPVHADCMDSRGWVISGDLGGTKIIYRRI